MSGSSIARWTAVLFQDEYRLSLPSYVTSPHSQTSEMPLRGSGGHENGRLMLDACITFCLPSAIF